MGFCFLYLLGRPLQKIPLIEADSEVPTPKWVLPMFAVGSLLLLSFSFSAALFLDLLRSNPNVEHFIRQYHKEIQLYSTKPGDKVNDISFSLDKFDGYSKFYAYINGYRLFSSEVNCLLDYQCLPYSEETSRQVDSIKSLDLKSVSLHFIKNPFYLPHRESILHFLVPGKNKLDLISINLGKGDCNISFTVTVSSDQTNITDEFSVLPAQTGTEPDIELPPEKRCSLVTGPADQVVFHILILIIH